MIELIRSATRFSLITFSVIIFALLGFYWIAQDTIDAAAPILVWGVVSVILVVALFRGGLAIYDRFEITVTHRSERKADRAAAKLAQQEADRRIEADVLAVELQHQKTQFETEIGQMQESLTTFNRLMTAMLPHIEQGNLFVTDLDPARPKFQHYPRQVTGGPASAPALPAGETDISLPTGFVAELMTFAPTDAPTIFVSAQPGAGKSTLLHHMADEIDGNVILIQIHEQIHPEDYATYGDRLRVIGMSNQRTEADEWDHAMRRACQIIDQVFAVMKKRYTQKPGKPILLLIDEYLDIRGWAKENGYEQTIANVTTLCTSRARKVGIAVVLASQTATASQLGFEGKADVLRGMTTLTLIRDRVSNQRRAIVRIAGGEPVDYQPLPRHAVVETQRQRRDRAALSLDRVSVDDELAAVETEEFDLSVWRDAVPDPEPSPDEQGAIQAYEYILNHPGQVSKRKATQMAFGEGKYGATYNDKLFRLWHTLNLDVSHLEFKA